MAENIYKYNQPFSSGDGTVIVKNANMLGYGANEGQTAVLEEHLFWGQPYNGQQDVNGDITIDKGNIETGCGDLHMKGVFNSEWSLGGNITADNHTKTKTLEVEEDTQIGGNLNVTNNLAVGYNITAQNATLEHSLSADDIKANKGVIENVESQDIKTHNLTVTGLAHFFELTIDKISASGGAVIYSPADGFEVERVINIVDTSNASNITLPVNYYINSYYEQQITVEGNDDVLGFNAIKCKRYDDDGHEYYYLYSNGNLFRDDDLLKYLFPEQYEQYIDYPTNVYYTNSNVFYDMGSPALASAFANDESKLAYPFKVVNEYIGEYDNELKLPEEYIDEYELTNTKMYQYEVLEPDVEGNYSTYLLPNETPLIIRYVVVREIATNYEYIWDIDNVLSNLAYNGYNNTDDKDVVMFKKDTFNIYDKPFLRQNIGYRLLWGGKPINVMLSDNRIPKLRHKYFKHGCSVKVSALTNKLLTKRQSILCWKLDDGDKARRNMWEVNDQAICRNFNQAQVGTTQNVSNKYYWALVIAKGVKNNVAIPRRITNNGKNVEYLEGEELAQYNYITLSNNYEDSLMKLVDGELNPEPGDEIAMLGNRNNVERQKAIYMSAYSSMDTSLKPPFIAQYEGINDFSLEGKKTTWFAANGNRILGDLVIESTGKSVEDTIDDNIGNYNEKIDGIKERLHLKVLPASERYMSYDDWYNQIGMIDYWITPSGVDVEEFKVGGVRRNNFDQIYDVTDGVYVLIESVCSHKYNYSQTEYPEDTYCHITVYGQVVSYTPKRDGSCSWGIKVLHILDGDLQNVWSSMAQIRVTQDGITLKVQDLDKGIAALQIKANQIESSVSSLENNMTSKLTQTANELRFEIDEVAKLIVDDDTIFLNENTIVNGNVTIPEPYEFDMVAKEGVTHLQSKSIGSLTDFYTSTHSQTTLSFTKNVAIPDWQAGTGTNGANTVRFSVSYYEDFTINAKQNNWVISLSNHSCSGTFTNPNNNLSYGSRGYSSSFAIKIINQLGVEIVSVGWSSTTGTWNYTISKSGTYKLRIIQYFGLTYVDSNRDNIPDNKYAGGAKLTGTTSIVLTQPIVDGDNGEIQSKSCLGPDGYSANFGNGGVVWIGKDQTSLNYGPYELCIKADGIYKRYPDSDGASSIRGSYNADKLIRLKDVVIETGTSINGKTECICPSTNITLPSDSTVITGTRIIVLGGHYNGANSTSSSTVVTYTFRGRSRTVTVTDGQIMTFIFSSGGWWHD